MPKKPNILILAPYPHQIAPSQRFRFEQYLGALTEAGANFEIHPFISLETWQVLHKPRNFLGKALGILKGFWQRLLLLFRLGNFSFVFIHREASHIGPPIFEWAIAKLFGKKIIYDFDDAIWMPNYSEHNASFHKLKYYQKVKHSMKWAHKIAAGNEYLASFAKQFNPNVIVLPTTIDTENHHNQVKQHQPNQKIIIGWTGTLTTAKYIEDIIPVLQQLEQKFDFEFRMISNEIPAYQLKSLKFQPWKKETEIADLLAFDIGLMPLVDDKWAKGKCGFKALQYMALGIPPVVSPVGVNTQIVEHGKKGMICQSPEEWERSLSELMTDFSLRQKLGAEARKTVEDSYSVKANTQKFLSLFDLEIAKN